MRKVLYVGVLILVGVIGVPRIHALFSGPSPSPTPRIIEHVTTVPLPAPQGAPQVANESPRISSDRARFLAEVQDAAAALLSREWPTAATVQLVSVNPVWLDGNRRVVHAIFDAHNNFGALVREKELIAYELDGDTYRYNTKEWSHSVGLRPTPDQVSHILVANGWAIGAWEQEQRRDAERKRAADKRVVATEVIGGVRFDIHDDGTRTIVRQ